MFHQKGGGILDIFRTVTKPLAPVFKPLEPVFKPIAPVVNPILEEAAGIGDAVGGKLLQNILQDAIAGKSSKATARAHTQQAKLNAKNMAAQRVIQALFQARQNGDGNALPEDIKLGTSSKAAERINYHPPPSSNPPPVSKPPPASKPPKRKRGQSKPKKPAKKQKGGSIARRTMYRDSFEPQWNTIDQNTLQTLFKTKRQTGGRRKARKPRRQRRKPQRGLGKKRKSQTECDIFS